MNRRFLITGDEGMATALAWKLYALENEDCKMYIADKNSKEHLRGIVPQVQSLEEGLRWVGKQGYVISEDEGDVTQIRKAGFRVYGNNAFCKRLEDDRIFQLETCSWAGLKISNYHQVQSLQEAIRFIKEHPDAYAIKQVGTLPKTFNYVGREDDGSDATEQLRWMAGSEEFQKVKNKAAFVLQERVDGTEVAVSAWWQYNDWLRDDNGEILTTLNFENKKANDGDLGLTCFSADTELLTRAGWKTFDAVSLEDEVASCTPDSLSMFYEHPTAVIWKQHDGKLLNFHGRYLDLSVTPEHRMFGAPRRRRKKMHFFAAHGAYCETVIAQCGTWSGTELPVFVLPPHKDGRGYVWAALEISADDWFQFMGLYLSEGSTFKNGINIAQVKGRKRDEMEAIVKRLPFNYCNCKVHIKIFSSQLAAYCKQFGLCYSKFVPDYIKQATPRQIELFVNAYVLGDGCRRTLCKKFRSPTRRITTTSKRMADDLQELFLKLGRVSVVSTRSQELLSKLPGGLYACRLAYSIEESTRRETSVSRPRAVDYFGMVGCVTVPTSHLIFVRRAGRVAICGNCGESGTIARVEPAGRLFSETLELLTPILLKKASDVCVCIDANCGITEDDTPYLFELTVREGYPAQALEGHLIKKLAGDFFADLIDGKQTAIEYDPNWGEVLVMGSGNWPHETTTDEHTGSYKDQPVWADFDETLIPLYVRQDANEDFYRVADHYEYICCAVASGDVISENNDKCVDRLKSVQTRDPIFRLDIGRKEEEEKIPALMKLGYLDSPVNANA